MLRSTPTWVHERSPNDRMWPGRVHLEKDHVFSEFYCLNRHDGSTRWELSLEQVNWIAGVHDGVLLCGQVEPGWRPAEGACAVRLEDGAVVWEKQLAVFSVEGGAFICADGSVRDIESAEVRASRAPQPEHAKVALEETLHWAIAKTQFGAPPVPFAPGVSISRLHPRREQADEADYFGIGPDHGALWSFSLAANGWHCGKTRHDRVARPPYVFLLASREAPVRHISAGEIDYVPCQRHLLVLDARVGQLVQEVDVGTWVGGCEIGDVDADGLVLRLEDRRIIYFERQPETSAEVANTP